MDLEFDYFKHEEILNENREFRRNQFSQREIPKDIRTIEEFLAFWTELEDVTTEKNKEKAHFILRDKIEGFKLYFWKSGFVKKQNRNGSQCAFLNDWNCNVNKIYEGSSMSPLTLRSMIYHAHQFMISQKVFCNVDMYFRERKETRRRLAKGGMYEIDERTGAKIWVV